MNNKISLQELAQGLAKRKKTTRKEAESFVRNVFDTIVVKVIEDSVVKVKGLGTFKVIIVDSRESIDINTGERIVIDPHARITFAPQATLRDAVNKPFADFETVILNEDTSTEDMERIPMLSDEESVSNTEETAVLTNEVQEEQVSEEQSQSETVLTIETAHETILVADSMPELGVEDEVSLQVQDTDDPSRVVTQMAEPAIVDAPNEKPTKKKGVGLTCGRIATCITFALLLIAYSFFLGYKYGISSATSRPVKPTAVVATKGKTWRETTSSKVVEQTKPMPALKQPESIQEDFINKYPQVEGGEYWITGTKEEHTIVVGDNLLVLSVKVYGDKNFAQYIIKYNDIKNPDILILGSTIKFPKLQKKN